MSLEKDSYSLPGIFFNAAFLAQNIPSPRIVVRAASH